MHNSQSSNIYYWESTIYDHNSFRFTIEHVRVPGTIFLVYYWNSESSTVLGTTLPVYCKEEDGGTRYYSTCLLRRQAGYQVQPCLFPTETDRASGTTIPFYCREEDGGTRYHNSCLPLRQTGYQVPPFLFHTETDRAPGTTIPFYCREEDGGTRYHNSCLLLRQAGYQVLQFLFATETGRVPGTTVPVYHWMREVNRYHGSWFPSNEGGYQVP